MAQTESAGQRMALPLRFRLQFEAALVPPELACCMYTAERTEAGLTVAELLENIAADPTFDLGSGGADPLHMSIDGYRLLATQRVDAVMREDDLAQVFAGAMGTPAKPRSSAACSQSDRHYDGAGDTAQAGDGGSSGPGAGSRARARARAGSRSSSTSSSSSSSSSSTTTTTSTTSTSTTSSSTTSCIGSNGNAGGEPAAVIGLDTDSGAGSNSKESGSSRHPVATRPAADRPYTLSQSAKRRLRRLRLKNFLRAEQKVCASGAPKEGTTSTVPRIRPTLSSQENHLAENSQGQLESPSRKGAVESDARADACGVEAANSSRKRRRGSATRTLTGAQLLGNDPQQLSSLAKMAAARREMLEQQQAVPTAATERSVYGRFP